MPNRFKKNGMHGGASSPIGERISKSETSAREGRSIRDIFQTEKPTAAQQSMHFILEHPGICLGTALALGVLVGWLLKRK
jgi:ElaB/YqjD/DUF883 family membrane-anchored ribosome-binding protein